MRDLLANPPYLDLATLADKRVLEMMKLMKLLWASDRIDKIKARTLATISTTCLSTTGSVLILIERGRVWDADVLQRGVMEGTIRFLYLLHGDGELVDRFHEFNVSLEDSASLRLHRRAKIFLKSTTQNSLDDGSQKTLESLMLSPEEFQAISKELPKKIRRALEDKWSFGKLLTDLVAKNILPAVTAEDFQLRYLKSSQSIHANPLGIASFFERTHRAEPNNTWANYAHAASIAKMMRDLCLYRLYGTYMFLGADMKGILDAYQDENFDQLCTEIFNIHHESEYSN